MASEESVLVEGLLEVGKKLSCPPSDVGQLIELLDEAEELLTKIEQSPRQIISDAFHLLMQSLVTKDLLKHPEMDVKIAVTCCISEITRITAPEPPYGDELMKEIFEMIVISLEGLDDDFSGRSYSKRVLILETVAKVKSCLVMLDLECDELILQMFHLFLKVIKKGHEEKIFKAMESIMTVVLEESEEISYEIAMCLLASVRKNNKDVSSDASALGKRVIQNCCAILKPRMREAIKLSGSHISDYHEIVASLFQDKEFKSHHPCEYLKEGSNASKCIGSKNVLVPSTMQKKDSMDPQTPSETPGLSRPRRGRPPGSKTRPKKESEDENNLEGKQLKSIEGETIKSNNDHSQKQAYKGKLNKEVNTNKDVNQSSKQPSSSKSISKTNKTGCYSKESQKEVTKRKVGQSEEKDIALDKKLLGSSIRVWWPEDKMFYRGVISSFDPSTKKHTVLYVDGEVENLILKDEIWEFFDGSSGEDEVQNRRPHLKKPRKVKTNSGSAIRKTRIGTPKGRACSDMAWSKKELDGSGEKSEKTGSESTQKTSRNSSIKHKNGEPGTPEVPCKLEIGASTPGKMEPKTSMDTDGKQQSPQK